MHLFEDRQISTAEALKELEKALGEYTAAQREIKERGFDMRTFSVYWILHRGGVKGADELAPVLSELFTRYPNFRENPDERRDLKAELYKILLPHVSKAQRPELAEAILKVRRT